MLLVSPIWGTLGDTKLARTIRDAGLETRTARLRLKPRRRPYWVGTGKKGVRLGYRRTQTGSGSWVAFQFHLKFFMPLLR